ncbi:MAG: L-serine ammonia-lyase, partial [Candidatus Dactylopiibacterium sp.]|nr:L-serine ammonia-lyase [Candidatus Dactylopiibacterium sp.]
MLSVFEMFKIGIGPSSSHTVGPMVAAARFAAEAGAPEVARVSVDLYGALALTGHGHGTLDAVLCGLEGWQPRHCDPAAIAPRAGALRQGAALRLGGAHEVGFDFARDVRLHREHFLPQHPNGMRCAAHDARGRQLAGETYFSIGGGFVVTAAEFGRPAPAAPAVPYPFDSAAALLAHCRREGCSIAALVWANECALRPAAEVREGLLGIARAMRACIEAGCRHEGVLAGGYGVRRRAPGIFAKLAARQASGQREAQPWPMLYAMAVNEENAAGGRVVTAPTNGAAGVVPAVLQSWRDGDARADEQGVIDFLLTAGAIGMLYKMNASISGAEVGCQGEVGVACSMAAGALCAVRGGTLAQIENAAEIAMEHHLGLTCDPVGGLVQIPCIERNGIAAEKAINVAELALLEDGEHKVSLDQVIATMYRTGLDMQRQYKEDVGGSSPSAPTIQRL